MATVTIWRDARRRGRPGGRSAPRHRRGHRRRVLDAHVEAVVQVGLRVGDQRPATLADEHAGRVGRRLPVARPGLRRRVWLGHDVLLAGVAGLSTTVPPRPTPARKLRIAMAFAGCGGRSGGRPGGRGGRLWATRPYGSPSRG